MDIATILSMMQSGMGAMGMGGATGGMQQPGAMPQAAPAMAPSGASFGLGSPLSTGSVGQAQYAPMANGAPQGSGFAQYLNSPQFQQMMQGLGQASSMANMMGQHNQQPVQMPQMMMPRAPGQQRRREPAWMANGGGMSRMMDNRLT